MQLNKIYNMDCNKGIKTIPDNSIDLMFADPLRCRRVYGRDDNRL